MQTVTEVEAQAFQEILQCGTTEELKQVGIKFLGNQGLLTGMLRQIGSLPAEERRGFGQQVNEAKGHVEEKLALRQAQLKESEREIQFQAERLDVTMPGRQTATGYQHVLDQASDRIKAV